MLLQQHFRRIPDKVFKPNNTALFGNSFWITSRQHGQSPQQAGLQARPAPQYSQDTLPDTRQASFNGSAAQQQAHDKRLMLVDAHALLYRFHYAYGPKLLTDGRGRDTSIAYGFLQTLLALLELQPPPTHMAVVFDAKGKNFRHEMFSDYKANRPAMPEEIRIAAPRIKELLTAMGVPLVSVPGVEADDVIGSLSTRAISDGFAIAIASPDKDFYQLLQPKLQLLRPPRKQDGGKLMSGRLVAYNQQSFEEEFEIQPSQWPDVLAISGDSADNIPGIPGIGMKGALGLIRQFGSLSALLERSAEVARKKQRETLSSEEGAAAARLGLELVTIQTELQIPPVRMPFSELELQQPTLEQQKQVLDFLEDMNFKQHTARLQRVWAAGILR